jgi:hypothetical protein
VQGIQCFRSPYVTCLCRVYGNLKAHRTVRASTSLRLFLLDQVPKPEL